MCSKRLSTTVMTRDRVVWLPLTSSPANGCARSDKHSLSAASLIQQGQPQVWGLPLLLLQHTAPEPCCLQGLLNGMHVGAAVSVSHQHAVGRPAGGACGVAAQHTTPVVQSPVALAIFFFVLPARIIAPARSLAPAACTILDLLPAPTPSAPQQCSCQQLPFQPQQLQKRRPVAAPSLQLPCDAGSLISCSQSYNPARPLHACWLSRGQAAGNRPRRQTLNSEGSGPAPHAGGV
jgi:hypothetical protein